MSSLFEYSFKILPVSVSYISSNRSYWIEGKKGKVVPGVLGILLSTLCDTEDAVMGSVPIGECVQQNVSSITLCSENHGLMLTA